MFKRINPVAFKKYWCQLKHLLVDRELGIEYVSNVARQITTSEKNVEEVLVKSAIISQFISQIEERIQHLLDSVLFGEDVADATWVRVDVEQFRRFLQQIGHIVCCEEHYADHIKAGCMKLINVQDEKEQERIQDEVLRLWVLLEETRNTRQEYITQFIAPIAEEEAEEKRTSGS